MTKPFFPVIELYDRLAIAQIKQERIGNNHAELAWYSKQISISELDLIYELFVDLKKIHELIWDLEAALKSGVEDHLPLDEIGRRAILIRDFNNKRIKIKNQMAEILKCSIREIKSNHLSE